MFRTQYEDIGLDLSLIHIFCKRVAVTCTVYGIDFVAHAHGMAFGDNLVSAKGKRSIVVHAVGELGKLVVSGKVDVVNLCLAMPYTDEVDALGIFEMCIRDRCR